MKNDIFTEIKNLNEQLEKQPEIPNDNTLKDKIQKAIQDDVDKGIVSTIYETKRRRRDVIMKTIQRHFNEK